MATSYRWVCKSSEECNFEDVKKILESEAKGSREGKSFDVLKHVIRLNPQIISTDNSSYLSGTLFYEDEFKKDLYELNDEGELVEQEDKPQKTTEIVDFWISDKGIFLFRNSQTPTKKGKELLSEFIFKDPKKIDSFNYDIVKVEEDIKSGLLQGMWTYNFKDRNGNVTSGTHYGENVNTDALYDQTIGAPKNWIGVQKEIDGEIIKISIYRSGSIGILKNFEDPTKISKVFNVVEEYSKYATVPSR